MGKKLLVLSTWVVVAMALCSCGKPDIRTLSSRSVVPVNGKATSAEHINGDRAQNDRMTRAQAGRTAELIRARTADQELLAQEALQGRLDRDVQVAQAIELARRQVLARAYIERTVVSAPQASPQEIRKFYEENPALFGQRRLYRVLELVVVVAPAQLGALQDVVAGAKDLAEIVRWLDSRKLPFDAAMPSRTAEQIPMNILHRLFAMRDGQIAIFPTARGASVLRVEQFTEAPLSEKQAGPSIAKYLLNRKRLELAQAAVAQLRERAEFDHDGGGPVRAATVTQIAARTQSRTAGPGMARDTIDSARLR